jgi:hypothetical protein
LELGLDTFGDATVDEDGNELSQAQAIRDLVTPCRTPSSLPLTQPGREAESMTSSSLRPASAP